MPDMIDRIRKAFEGVYDIEREVGAGGMATVYLARDVKHERRVAVKILRPELANALGGDRFPREIKIVAQLSHPHILPLHDSGELDGFYYYVMPFVDGESLRDRMDREGALPIPEAVRILREVTDALAYAHGHGVVHRDIKPDNVMLAGRHAIVTDFGVAKAVSDAGGQKLTTVGVALGTPSYMAPEQATGDLDIDHRADIYAIGVLAYEMLTGKRAFERPTAQAILAAQVLETPEPMSTLRPGLPPVLDDVVQRCIAKSRDDRWQTADEMLPYLEGIGTPSGGVTPTDTRPINVTTAQRKTSRRVWIGSVAAALVAVGGVGGVLMFGGSGPSGIEQVAVLPIQDLSGDDQVFVDGMHDALISALARADIVGVVSRSAVMPYRDGGATTREIARDLGVQAVIEGTVFRSGDRVRINVQMVEPNTLRHLWSQTYERDVDDVLDVQDEIVEAIAAELGTVLADRSSDTS